jgi:uncharacterized protein YndB with AHSA1/START domain
MIRRDPSYLGMTPLAHDALINAAQAEPAIAEPVDTQSLGLLVERLIAAAGGPGQVRPTTRGPCYGLGMSSTRIHGHVNAPRTTVFRALIDADAVATWMVPTGMTSHVHAFDPREGGSFRISLTYDEPTGTGKTTAHTDTYHGRFVKLVPNEQVVEVVEFETTDPALRGEMTITITLSDADGGTDVVGLHEGLPPGISAADNEAGWRSALDRLAELVEAD